MIKGLIKTLLIIVLILIIAIIYLSVIGVKTDKFNNQIKKNISEINKQINFELREVTYLLNPHNFSISITTKNSQILIEDDKIDINSIKTNVSLKSLFSNKFLIDNLKISTAEMKVNDLVLLVREVHNTPQLFILNTIIKAGFIAADININFDSKGKIKNDYQIKGFIKNARLDLFNKSSVKNLNFLFDVTKSRYSLSKINTTFNEIKFNLPFIQILYIYFFTVIITSFMIKISFNILFPVHPDMVQIPLVNSIFLSSNSCNL